MAAVLALLVSGCVSLPDRIEPVQDFAIERYLGTWYEIARLDHSFERGLSRVSADYSLRDDGGVRVLNRGYSAAKGGWQEAEGKAYFARRSNEGFLKVSFFGPFYGAYIIFFLDREYRHALVCGPDRSYFWLLAREPVLPDAVLSRLLAEAAAQGFDTSQVIRVDQGPLPAAAGSNWEGSAPPGSTRSGDEGNRQ